MNALVDEVLSSVLYQNKKRVKEDVTKLLQHTATVFPRLGTLSKISIVSVCLITINDS